MIKTIKCVYCDNCGKMIGDAETYHHMSGWNFDFDFHQDCTDRTIENLLISKSLVEIAMAFNPVAPIRYEFAPSVLNKKWESYGKVTLCQRFIRVWEKRNEIKTYRDLLYHTIRNYVALPFDFTEEDYRNTADYLMDIGAIIHIAMPDKDAEKFQLYDGNVDIWLVPHVEPSGKGEVEVWYFGGKKIRYSQRPTRTLCNASDIEGLIDSILDNVKQAIINDLVTTRIATIKEIDK